jgi:hypothetical protein
MIEVKKVSKPDGGINSWIAGTKYQVYRSKKSYLADGKRWNYFIVAEWRMGDRNRAAVWAASCNGRAIIELSQSGSPHPSIERAMERAGLVVVEE